MRIYVKSSLGVEFLGYRVCIPSKLLDIAKLFCRTETYYHLRKKSLIFHTEFRKFLSYTDSPNL